MPLPYARRGTPRVYLPGYRSMSASGFDRALRSLGSGTMAPRSYGDFEQDEIVKAQQGGLQFNVNELIHLGIKQPAYAVEAPLRPLSLASKAVGFQGPTTEGVEHVIGQVPVLSNILGGLGEGLKFLDDVGAALPNHGTADILASLVGKPDDYMMPVGSVNKTAGDYRRAIMDQWGTDHKGNQYTLAELEARAKNSPWDFGQFATAADGGTDELIRLITNPLNLLILPGAVNIGVRGAIAGVKAAGRAVGIVSAAGKASEAARVASGIRYLKGAGMADSWARPIIKPTGLVSSNRYGYGYAKSLGRGIAKAYSEAHHPSIEFRDVISSARAISEGELRAEGTIKGLAQALAWGARGAKTVGRKVYFPGLNTELRGARLAGAGARAWMRGGIQQQLALGGSDMLFGNINNYLVENDMNNNIVGGVTGTLHDILSNVQNDHPLSDSQAFVMASLLMPAFKAAREIPSPITNKWRESRLPLYVDNVAGNLRERLNKQMGATFKNNEAMFEAIGRGDIQRGRAMFEWWVEKSEVLKVENQLSHLTQQIADAEIDGLVARNEFIGDVVRDNILRRRKTGALKPGSTADYMIEQHFNPGEIPGKVKKNLKGKQNPRELASELTGTADSFMREIQNLWDTFADEGSIGNQARELGLDIVKGGILDRETMGVLIEHVRLTPEGQISRDLAREIIDMGPSLVYEQDSFWRQFAVTLGQEQRGGVFGKGKAAAEAVSKDDLIARLTEIRDGLPSAQELFNETIAASKAQGVAKGDVFRIKEPPYPMGEKLKANRAKATGRVMTLSDNERALHNMRTTEFYKSGKPRFGAASEIAGSEGGVFRRVEPMKAPEKPPAAMGVDDVPASKAPSADLLGEYKPREPNSIKVHEAKLWTDFKDQTAVWYGPDGTPKGYAQVIGNKKGPTGIAVYVDPAFRRQGVATRLYEELQKAGADLGRISGTTVTAEGRAFAESFRASRPASPIYRRADGVGVHINKGVINMLVPADREATLLAQLDKTLFKSGPRKGSIKPGMEAESAKLNLMIEAGRLGIDIEALVLAAKNNGRIIVADRAAGPLLAGYGFVESARVRGTGQASYSYRGGDPSKILANRDAKAFSEYRPTMREASEKGAIGIARRDAINASMFLPTTESITKSAMSEGTMFPAERLRFIKERQAATTRAYKQELADIAGMDEIAFDMLLFDKKLTDMNLGEWVDGLSTKEYGKVRTFMRDSYSSYPNLSLKPDQPRVFVDPAQSRFSTLVAHRNRMQDLLVDYGPLAPIQRLYDALLAPKHVRWLGKQTQTEVHNLLALSGVSPAASRKFIQELRQEILDSRAVRGLGSLTGSHKYGSIAALEEEKIRAIASRAFPEQYQAVLDRWGDYQKMFTESSNRLLRTVQRTTRTGGKVNKIAEAANAAFRVWQYAPGFEKLSFAGQRFTKYTYPYFRFHSDPVFAAMNWIEPYVYNVFNQGWRGLRPVTAETERLSELASANSIPAGGLFDKEVATELLMADPGFYTFPKNIRPNLHSNFRGELDMRAEQLFEAMSKDHPIAELFRERFGDNVKDWAAEMNRLMANMVEKGPEFTIRAEWKATLENELGYSLEQLKMLAPVGERLTEVYRGIHADMADLYIGRMNRSNIERLANNYFVLWPASYMIKASAWAYRVLFEKIGPVNGSVGAYAWDQYRQKYERALEEKPDFRAWTEDNRDFLFMAELILPITPSSVGTSIGKTTRYVGSWLSREIADNYISGFPTDLFGEYGVDDVGSVVEGATRIGPARTINAANKILQAWQVPGFYRESQRAPEPLLP